MNANVSVKLENLRGRAVIIKNNPALRHSPSADDLRVASENARDLAHAQYKTIKVEEGERL